MPAASSRSTHQAAGRRFVSSEIAAFSALRFWVRRRVLENRSSVSQSGRAAASQKRSNWAGVEAAMLIGPSADGKTPIGAMVGWSLPIWPATSPAISQRAAWKSSRKICDSSSDATCARSPALAGALAVVERHHGRCQRQHGAGGDVPETTQVPVRIG